ncbi:MAG: ABC transporter permease [Candidatus Saccharimonadales bacterium]
MTITYILIALLVVFILKRAFKIIKQRSAAKISSKPKKKLTGWQKQLFTVIAFTRLSTQRFFRDRLAIFFTVLFPLIFLFVFGALTNSNNKVSFKVAVINQSHSVYASEVVKRIDTQSEYKVDKTVKTLSQAETKMDKNQLDSAIVLPSNFGENHSNRPTGQVKVYYTVNNQSAGQTIIALLPDTLKPVNAHFVDVNLPFTIVGNQLKQRSLTQFDYTFSGLLGFTIIGVGIFGPVNVFPELKKQGILRRLHTTPIRVWQYFLSTMFSQAITGSISVLVQFLIAISVFHLKIYGNYLEILVYLVLCIFMILGIGLAIGGWAKNERQAAPLSNIIVFPMLFLSGTFFPRYDMPQWLQSVTNWLPLTPVIDGLRMLTTEGKDLLQIGPQIGLVALWMVVIYAIAFKVFRWE